MYGLTHDLLGSVHLLFALGAIIIGAVVTFLRKGTKVHRRWGWAYLIAMLGLNGTALLMYRLFGTFGPFHFAALASLLTLLAGIVPALKRPRGWIQRHARFMAWSYVGLLAAAAAETLSRIPQSPFWVVVLGASFAVIAIGGVLIRVLLPVTLRPFLPKAQRSGL